ncbi:hypothetical protein L1049_014055 [Liquidambar formosana]|uniref:HRDC domain-containing protein n=1 Tax=Liquidambar formosana TaxID=63359 RepID=A0AAP0RR70_LIQFO
MLLEERMKLARGTGTAPYAICGDQTVKKIALTRPSTKARLANIDGVNQNLVATHGDHFLQTIRRLSQGLNLSLDGDGSIRTTITGKVYPVPNQQRKFTPAKFEAWKMWHEGLSVHKIANFPGRSAPIKEQTVLEYLLEAAQEGFAIDWTRLCDEAGMTHEMFSEIQGAISKVGSKDKLKPIKDELPEYVSYTHIKACLTMQECGVPTEIIPPSGPHTWKADELNRASESRPGSIQACCIVETSVENTVAYCCLETNDKSDSVPFTLGPAAELPLVHDDNLLFSSKRQRIDRPEEESSVTLEATEMSILNWLKNYSDGVPVSDILEHFNGSREECVVDLLTCLEGEFLIFKKNNLYLLM